MAGQSQMYQLRGGTATGEPDNAILRNIFGYTYESFWNESHAKKQWNRTDTHLPAVMLPSPSRHATSTKYSRALASVSPYLQETHSPAVSAAADVSQSVSLRAVASQVEEHLPKTLSVDNTVLHFPAYSVDSVPQTGGRREASRIRRLVISFHLEDNTVAIMEPSVPNSGLVVRSFLKRTRVAVGAPQRQLRIEAGLPERLVNAPHLGPDDFVVGRRVIINGRCIVVVDADRRTRNFCASLGCPQPAASEPLYPDTPSTDLLDMLSAAGGRSLGISIDTRSPPGAEIVASVIASGTPGSITRPLTSLRGLAPPKDVPLVPVVQSPEFLKRRNMDSTIRFLQDDGKRCMFKLHWDNRSTPHGDVRTFELRYYVVDDTVEVLEVPDANSGRVIQSLFLQRGRLPRSATVAARLARAVFTADVQESTLDPGKYLLLEELIIGRKIDVLGREMLVAWCSDATRQYMEAHGVPQPPNLDTSALDAAIRNDPPDAGAIALPPVHNGIGSEEDSLGAWLRLIVRAPAKDLVRWRRYDGVTLKFALLKPPEVEKAGGLFNAIANESAFLSKLVEACKLAIVSPLAAAASIAATKGRPIGAPVPPPRYMLEYFLSDGTLQIMERADGTGHVGGKFLSRQRVRRYRGTEGTDSFLQWSDIYTGARLNINHHQFFVVGCSEYTKGFRYTPEHLPPFIKLENIAPFLEQAAEHSGGAIDKDSDCHVVAASIRSAFSLDEPMGEASFGREALGGGSEGLKSVSKTDKTRRRAAFVADFIDQFAIDRMPTTSCLNDFVECITGQRELIAPIGL